MLKNSGRIRKERGRVTTHGIRTSVSAVAVRLRSRARLVMLVLQGRFLHVNGVGMSFALVTEQPRIISSLLHIIAVDSNNTRRGRATLRQLKRFLPPQHRGRVFDIPFISKASTLSIFSNAGGEELTEWLRARMKLCVLYLSVL